MAEGGARGAGRRRAMLLREGLGSARARGGRGAGLLSKRDDHIKEKRAHSCQFNSQFAVRWRLGPHAAGTCSCRREVCFACESLSVSLSGLSTRLFYPCTGTRQQATSTAGASSRTGRPCSRRCCHPQSASTSAPSPAPCTPKASSCRAPTRAEPANSRRCRQQNRPRRPGTCRGRAAPQDRCAIELPWRVLAPPRRTSTPIGRRHGHRSLSAQRSSAPRAPRPA